MNYKVQYVQTGQSIQIRKWFRSNNEEKSEILSSQDSMDTDLVDLDTTSVSTDAEGENGSTKTYWWFKGSI